MGAPTVTAPRARACTCHLAFQPRRLHPPPALVSPVPSYIDICIPPPAPIPASPVPSYIATAPRAHVCTCQLAFQPRCLHPPCPSTPCPWGPGLLGGPGHIFCSFISRRKLGLLPPITHPTPCSRGHRQKGNCDPKFLLSLNPFSWLSCVKSL